MAKKKKDKINKAIILFLAFATTIAFSPFLLGVPGTQQPQQPPQENSHQGALEFEGDDNDETIQIEVEEGAEVTEEELMRLLEEQMEEQAREDDNEEELEPEN